MSKASLASWVLGSLSPGVHADSAATRATTAAKVFQASPEEVWHSSTLCPSCLAYSASLGFRGKHLLGEGEVSSLRGITMPMQLGPCNHSERGQQLGWCCCPRFSAEKCSEKLIAPDDAVEYTPCSPPRSSMKLKIASGNSIKKQNTLKQLMPQVYLH